MLVYWLIFLMPASIALFLKQRSRANLILFLFIGFIFLFIIGFRYEVGGDWGNYLRHYNNIIGVPFSEIFGRGKDPGHVLLNWLMARWDLGVYGTNVIYGTVFIIGLIKFSRDEMYPWIAMVVAVPYMVIVVAMGYSRQSIALGIFMLAITYLRKGKIKTYVILILIAALFHKTAIILLPLGMFLYSKGTILRILMIIPITYGAWDLLLAGAQENMWYHYVEKQMQSDGAKIRVIMNFLPSILLLMYRKEWKRSFNDYLFWFWIAIASVFSIVLVGFATTAIDRIALYFIPIQLVVYARLPYLARNTISPSMTKVIIILGYTAVLFVWLNYATHTRFWLPYQNILWLDLF